MDSVKNKENSIQSFDLNKICRACLTQREEMRSLYDVDGTIGQGLRLMDILTQSTSVQIEMDDDLPSLLCLQCAQQASQCLSFKQLCQQSDMNLRQYLGKPMFDLPNKFKPDHQVLLSSLLNPFKEETESTDSTDEEDDLDSLDLEAIAHCNPQDEKQIAQKQLLRLIRKQKGKGMKNAKNKSKAITDSIRNSKSKKSPMQCNACKKTFLNSKSFRKHLRTHFEDRPFKCVECPRSFTEENYLKNHMRTHIPDEKKPHECEHCNKRFIHITLLRKHLLKHSDQKPFICKICDKGCYAENSLVKHMKIHERKQGDPALLKHICDYCKVEMESAQQLAEHIKHHSGNRPFLCTICAKSFPQRFNLELHLRTHTGERPFTCEICKNGYVSKASLKIHMRTHTNERPFVCDFCGKAFRQSGDLTSHKRLHGTEKPIECSVCQKRFTTVMKLKYHMRNHTGERPYVCNVCGRGFTVNTILLRHMRVHSGERPYVCVTCGKAFSQSSTLNTHMKVHQSQASKFQAIEEAAQVRLPHQQLQPQVENAHILSSDPTRILNANTAHLLNQYKALTNEDKFLDSTRIIVNVTDGNLIVDAGTANRLTAVEDQLIDDSNRLLGNLNMNGSNRILNDKFLNGYDPFQRGHL